MKLCVTSLLLIIGTSRPAIGAVVTVVGDEAKIGLGHTLTTGIYSSITGGKTNAITGDLSFIGGGQSNRISGVLSVIGGGTNNYNGGREAVIAGGRDNYIAIAKHTTISGGHNNAIHTSFGEHAVIGGGEQNTNNGMWSAIGGGFVNYISSNAESSTIGGGFSNFVYSKWGTIGGGLTNFLNDETGVIAGGWGNKDVGYYSAIGGGAYNKILTNGTDDSGQGAFIGGGSWNTNSAPWGFIGGGSANEIHNGYVHVLSGGAFNRIYADRSSVISGGEVNLITNAPYATISGGFNNIVSAESGTVLGGTAAHARNFGQIAHAGGAFSTIGDAQASQYILRQTTTSGTLIEMFLDAGFARMDIPSGSTWTFEVQVVGRNTLGDSAGYVFSGVIENIGGATALVAAVNKTILAEDVPAWDASVVADNANDALIIKVAGDTSTVRWVATVRTTEVQN